MDVIMRRSEDLVNLTREEVVTLTKEDAVNLTKEEVVNLTNLEELTGMYILYLCIFINVHIHMFICVSRYI
jgi:hypothetical protein